jgi:peptidyl-prolyl cis-trans isomerase D
MLASFRRHLGSWVARLFFLLLVATFVLWGVGDVIRNLGNDSAVATVAGRSIEMPQVQEAYRRQLAEVTRMFGGNIDPPAQMKKGIAAQAVEQVITQEAVDQAAANMGIAVPDAAVRQTTFDIPAFHNAAGQFDRAQFQTILRNNNLTEARYLDLIRRDLAQRQLTEAARAGAVSPDVLTREVYDFQHEQRIADTVTLAFAAATAPAAPTEEQLTRWYENNPTKYSTPEYRRIKAIILAPQTVASDVQVSDDDIKALYESHRDQYNTPEKRSVQVLLTQDEARAKELAAKWQGGADWAELSADKSKDGATPVELTDATRGEIPAPELGEAAFTAPQGSVVGPVHSALGWHVLKVTAITPGVTKSLADMHDELRTRLVAEKATDIIYDRASKIEDLLAGGTLLDELPGDLGVAAVTGTLDAQGNTTEGKPAPIPGSPGLRAALVQAAFQMKQGDPARLTEAPKEADGAQAYFAVVVEEITPPAPKPMQEVAAQVREDWTTDAIRHAQESKAAKILADVKAGKTLAQAVEEVAPGTPVVRLPPVGRASAEGVPAQLVDPLFGLKVGEPTMVETADGFIVAVLAQIIDADPNADPIGYGQVRDALAKAMADDTQAVLMGALRARGNPKVNAAMVDSIVQDN